jgi:hypothetical protein
MALASDGAVWMINDVAGVTRLDPAGGTREFLGGGELLDEFAAGPNGDERRAHD